MRNFGVGAERIGGRNGDAEREERKVDNRDFERRRAENESSIAFGKAGDALKRGGQGLDLPEELRIREAVVGGSVDENVGGFERRVRGGAEEGDDVLGEGKRAVLWRKRYRRSEAMEGLGCRAEPALRIDPVVPIHFRHCKPLALRESRSLMRAGT